MLDSAGRLGAVLEADVSIPLTHLGQCSRPALHTADWGLHNSQFHRPPLKKVSGAALRCIAGRLVPCRRTAEQRDRPQTPRNSARTRWMGGGRLAGSSICALDGGGTDTPLRLL